MNYAEFQEKVKTAYHAKFPNGWCKFSGLCLGSGFVVDFGLISDINDQANKIRENDPIRLTFIFHDADSKAENLGELVGEVMHKTLYINPTSHYYAMSRRDLPARKVKGSPEKIVKSFALLFDRCYNIVKKEAANKNIYQQQNIPAKYIPE